MYKDELKFIFLCIFLHIQMLHIQNVAYMSAKVCQSQSLSGNDQEVKLGAPVPAQSPSVPSVSSCL